MNILIDKLPTEVLINGEKCKINSNFRTSLLFFLLMNDKALTQRQKIQQAMILYYDRIFPTNLLEEAIDKAMWFFRCGKDLTTSSKTGNSNKKVLDYDIDADLIYSAFLSQYNIDLQDIKYLHWWKFKALMDGLEDNNRICEIIKFRSVDVNKIKDKEQKKYYKQMQKIYEIKEELSEEDKKYLDDLYEKLK